MDSDFRRNDEYVTDTPLLKFPLILPDWSSGSGFGEASQRPDYSPRLRMTG